MSIVAKILIAVVAIEHLYILWLEMFAWTTRGPKVFRSLPANLFVPTKALAANQGLYNGFLAAGLLWGLLDRKKSVSIWSFFLSCIAIAGTYGSFSLGRTTPLLIQTVPAVIALLFLIAARRGSVEAIKS